MYLSHVHLYVMGPGGGGLALVQCHNDAMCYHFRYVKAPQGLTCFAFKNHYCNANKENERKDFIYACAS